MSSDKYKVGDIVDHHIHGTGKVTQTYQNGNIHVRFPSGNVHTNPSGEFMPKHLTKIKEHNMSVEQLISQIDTLDEFQLDEISDALAKKVEDKRQYNMNSAEDIYRSNRVKAYDKDAGDKVDSTNKKFGRNQKLNIDREYRKDKDSDDYTDIQMRKGEMRESVEQLISQISEDIDSVDLVHQILGEKILAKLEELKKSTMISYTKKALDPSSEKSVSNLASSGAHKLANPHGEYSDKDDGRKEDSKSVIRSQGINRAIKKISGK